MNRPVKRILVIVKPDDSDARRVQASMVEFLAARGVSFRVCEHRPDGCAETEDIAGRFDLVVILGGDGTIIGAARRLLPFAVPLVGVNLGRVGFLARIERADWPRRLDEFLAEGVRTSRRLVLRYEVVRDGLSVHTGLAVNDLVISRGELARLIRLGINFDGAAVSSLRADGLVLSTPTGSSAYGASAGGPFMLPDLRAFCLTPVCPFLNSFKSMVFPAEGVVRIRVAEGCGEVNLTEDGQSVFRLAYGDEVEVGQSGTDLLVADLGPQAYFEKMQKHGFLTER